jgi:hypothetical protein
MSTSAALHCTALEWGIMQIKIKLEIMKKKKKRIKDLVNRFAECQLLAPVSSLLMVQTLHEHVQQLLYHLALTPFVSLGLFLEFVLIYVDEGRRTI